MTKPRTRIMLWVAAAVGAVAVATAAIGAAVGSGPAALTDEEIASRLASDATGSTSSPGPSVTMSSDPAAATNDILRTAAGTVVAKCSATTVTLVSWSPNPGYRVDEVKRGPATKTSVWFESDTADDVLVEVACVGGKPVATELPEADDHGGRGDGRSGHDGSGGQ